MSPEQAAALRQFEQLVHHSPLDFWIAGIGATVILGAIILVAARQKPPEAEHRERWQLEDPRRDLWSRYFRGWWHVP
jgi:hypothetical protein